MAGFPVTDATLETEVGKIRATLEVIASDIAALRADGAASLAVLQTIVSRLDFTPATIGLDTSVVVTSPQPVPVNPGP
jgi:hypothetical protein